MGIAHSEYGEDRARTETPVNESSLQPPDAIVIRDALLELVKSGYPDWTASAIDNEPAIGIETPRGEFFIEVQDA